MGSVTSAMQQSLMSGNNVPRNTEANKARVAYGIQYLWHPTFGYWYTTRGNYVCVLPANATRNTWLVVIPQLKKTIKFAGKKNMESRAFAVAGAYSTQK